jgi:hypothetical protein
MLERREAPKKRRERTVTLHHAIKIAASRGDAYRALTAIPGMQRLPLT